MIATIFFAAAEGGLADLARETGEQFGFNTALFVAQAISFLIVSALLYMFAYKPILSVLEERRVTIAQAQANAERIKVELARAEAQKQEILTTANNQATKLIEEAREIANKVRETETQKAINQAEQIIVKAKEAAAQDHARMLTELKREVGRLVVQTTSKVTGKVLDANDQQRLIQETSRELAA